MSHSELRDVLDAVIHSLHLDGSRLDGGATSVLKHPWDLAASDYLAFARSDLTTAGAHGYVNALANAKRALHCQVDTVLHGLALRRVAEDLSFPQKHELLEEIGVVAPAILRRVNATRNDAEHELLDYWRSAGTRGLHRRR